MIVANAIVVASCLACGGGTEGPIDELRSDVPLSSQCSKTSKASVLLRYRKDGYRLERPLQLAYFDGKIYHRTTDDKAGRLFVTPLVDMRTIDISPLDKVAAMIPFVVDEGGVYFVNGVGNGEFRLMHASPHGGEVNSLEISLSGGSTLLGGWLFGIDDSDLLWRGSRVARISRQTGRVSSVPAPTPWGAGGSMDIAQRDGWWWWTRKYAPAGLFRMQGELPDQSLAQWTGSSVGRFVVTSDAVIVRREEPGMLRLLRLSHRGELLGEIAIPPQWLATSSFLDKYVVYANESAAVIWVRDFVPRGLNTFLRYGFNDNDVSMIACRPADVIAVFANERYLFWGEIDRDDGGYVLMSVEY